MSDHAPIIVAIDANVLINFMHIGQLELLGNLPGMTFMVPEQVKTEVTDTGQAQLLRENLGSANLQECALNQVEELEFYTRLLDTLGKGESACLALARERQWSLSSDERRIFRRTAIAEIGEGRILATPDLIVHAIRSNRTTVKQADGWKELLEQNRFAMKFSSFSELL